MKAGQQPKPLPHPNAAVPDRAGSGVLLDFALEERFGYRADYRIYVSPILEKQDARDRTNVIAHCGLLIGVHIELRDGDFAFMLRRKLLDHRRHHSAGSTPRCPEVDQRQTLLALNDRIEVGVSNRHELTVVRHHFSLILLERTCAVAERLRYNSNLPKRARNRPGTSVDLALDHIAIAVPSIAAALPVFEAIQGVKASAPELVPAQHVRVAFLGGGPARIELIEPTSEQSTVHKFLERRGPGLHHIAYRVADIRAELARLSAAGYRLIDREPRPGAQGHQVAFLHPQGTNGVLIELVEG